MRELSHDQAVKDGHGTIMQHATLRGANLQYAELDNKLTIDELNAISEQHKLLWVENNNTRLYRWVRAIYKYFTNKDQ